MPYLENIICAINSNYNGVFTDKKFKNSRAFGLTDSINRKVNDKVETIPAKLINGDYIYVGADDTYNLTYYHKLYSNSYSLIPNTSYGRSIGMEKCTSEVGIVVFGLKDRLDVSQYELEKIFNQYLLKKVDKPTLIGLKLNVVIINATSSTMDMSVVFNNEYKGIEPFLNERHIMFELKYKIEASYKKECFPTC